MLARCVAVCVAVFSNIVTSKEIAALLVTPPEIISGIYLSLLHRNSVVTNRLYPIRHMGKAGIANFAHVRLRKAKLTAVKLPCCSLCCSFSVTHSTHGSRFPVPSYGRAKPESIII